MILIVINHSAPNTIDPNDIAKVHRDTNGSRIVIQIGDLFLWGGQVERILLQKYRDRNGTCTATLFKVSRLGFNLTLLIAVSLPVGDLFFLSNEQELLNANKEEANTHNAMSKNSGMQTRKRVTRIMGTFLYHQQMLCLTGSGLRAWPARSDLLSHDDLELNKPF